MSRAWFAALALFLIRDCDVTGPGPGTVIVGTWGGDNAGLLADDTSAHAHIGCTYGDVHQPIVIGVAGGFDVPGEYLLRAYPVAVGPTMPARFHGSVSGWVMLLSVTVTDTVAHTTTELGPLKLAKGIAPKMGPCPICRVKPVRLGAQRALTPPEPSPRTSS